MALGGKAVEAVIALGAAVDIRVDARRIDRLVAHRNARAELKRAARQLEQVTRHRAFGLDEVRRRGRLRSRREIIEHILAVRRGIEEIVAAVGDHIEQMLDVDIAGVRSEEHTSELQSLMRISYAV